jgi:hypothetical protein
MLVAAMGGRLINAAGDRRGSGVDRRNTMCRRSLEAPAE